MRKKTEQAEETPVQRSESGEVNVRHETLPQHDTPDTQVPTPNKTTWCQHCAQNLSPGQSLAEHILAVHNHTITVESDGQERTKVVRFDSGTVVDASNCSSTPAFNVLCPIDLRQIQQTLNKRRRRHKIRTLQ
ncbi:hypothetical protein TNCV_2937561 [Trichonephila clavipes]|nr:hypothetical protein TNCV_2937561 [Trichonephila clavipes]